MASSLEIGFASFCFAWWQIFACYPLLLSYRILLRVPICHLPLITLSLSEPVLSPTWAPAEDTKMHETLSHPAKGSPGLNFPQSKRVKEGANTSSIGAGLEDGRGMEEAEKGGGFRKGRGKGRNGL